MWSGPDKKNAEKCGKKCGNNAGKKCGKMRSKVWDLEKLLICPDSGQGMGKKNHKSQTKKNTTEKISHQLRPISMKIGPNDILRGHFGHFSPFICPEVPEKVPQIPRN
jgi:hypothetical protein